LEEIGSHGNIDGERGLKILEVKGGDYSWQLKGKTTNFEKMQRKSKDEE
jgi:hypothetical protein